MLQTIRVGYQITENSPTEYGIGVHNGNPHKLICIIPDYATSNADIPRTVYDFEVNPIELIKKRKK